MAAHVLGICHCADGRSSEVPQRVESARAKLRDSDTFKKRFVRKSYKELCLTSFIQRYLPYRIYEIAGYCFGTAETLLDKSQISNSDAHLSVLFFSKKASVSDNSYSAIEEGGHVILHFELLKLRRSTNCMFNDPEDV